jgi:hypothetical protein
VSYGLREPFAICVLSRGAFCAQGDAAMKRLLRIVLVCIAVPVILPRLYLVLFLVLYPVLGLVSYLQGANLSPDHPGLKSQYVFTFGNGKVVRIQDDGSRILRSSGGSSDSIETLNGVRTVNFSESAILKTSVDSIAPNSDYVNVKGWMGIRTDDTEFIVGQDGEIDSTEWVD